MTRRQLYQSLGVREYLVYDLGGKRGPGSPRELLMYRLVDGAYHQVDLDLGLSEPDAHAYPSEVFGTHIRFQPDAREDAEEFRHLPVEHRPPPRFQWYDPAESRWRDHETDRDIRLKAEGVEEGLVIGREMERREMAIGGLHALLRSVLAPVHLGQIEEVWREHGPPPDVMDRLRDALQAPGEWRSLLLLDEPGDSNDPTPPTEKGLLRDG